MAILVDSYSESNYDNSSAMSATDRQAYGQSFTGVNGNINSCKFYLKKTGSPTGNMVAKLYAHSGSFGTSSVPTGSALATSDTFNVATLTGSWALVTLNFTGVNKVALTAGTKYCITVEYNGSGSGNSVDVGWDGSAPSHPGNFLWYQGGSWSAYNPADACFYVYADILPNPSFLLNLIHWKNN